MKRLGLIVFLLSFAASGAYSIGASVSLFIPEKGTLSIEQGLAGYIPLIKKYLDLPVALKYNKISGMMTEGISMAVDPWFYADTLQLYTGLKGYIPIGNFYITLEALGLLNWNVYLDALEGNIDRDIAASISGSQFASSDFTYSCGLGYGYSAGVGFGLRIERIRIDLMVSFLQAFSSISVSGDYRYVDSGGTVRTVNYQSPEGTRLRLQGWKIVLGFDFAL